MLPEIKSFSVNWVDGMKVSAQDFVAMDDATHDWIRDARCLTHYGSYGLLPTADVRLDDYKSDYPKFEFKYDQSSINIELQECRAILPNGLRVEITTENHRNLEIPYELPTKRINKDKNGIFDVLLSVELVDNGRIERRSAGKPMESGPPRLSQMIHHYVLHIKNPDLSSTANQLRIAQLEVENGQIFIDTDYIPSCLFLCSTPKLLKVHRNYLKILVDLIEYSKVILRDEKRTKGLRDLTDKLFYFIVSQLDHFEHSLTHRAPSEFVYFFKSLARIVDSYIACMSDRDNTLFLNTDYPSKCANRENQHLQEVTVALLEEKFNPNHIGAILDKTDKFMKILHCVFDELSSDRTIRTKRDNDNRPKTPEPPRKRRLL